MRIEAKGAAILYYQVNPSDPPIPGASKSKALQGNIESMDPVTGWMVLTVYGTDGLPYLCKNVALVRPGEIYPPGADYAFTEVDATVPTP